ncbi:MAG: hypothetical protein WD876_00080 [Candidatus Pacearchaeota archaeon]
MGDEITDTLMEGAKWLAVGGASYLLCFSALGLASKLLKKDEIKDEKHLREMLKEEAPKLGLNPDNIRARFGQTTFTDSAEGSSFSDGSHEIILNYKGRNRSSLQHELYHIYKKDSGIGFGYFFVQEPRAVMYEVFGIKL